MFQNLKHYIRNGLYIPFLHIFMYYITNNVFLSTIIALKMYPANYFFWFSHHYYYKNIPKQLYFVKQFVRFTDSGHIASFIYFLSPSFYPVAYNIHFVITVGYWTGRIILKLEDKDDIFTPENITLFENMWSYSIHILPLLLLVRELWIEPSICKKEVFILKDLYYSYLWLFTWFFCIYIPWRLITNDYLYTVFAPKTDIKTQLFFSFFIIFLIFIANSSGSILYNTYCLT